MWYLLEDFFEQSWVLKLGIGLGWLSVLIMLMSMYSTIDAMVSAGA